MKGGLFMNRFELQDKLNHVLDNSTTLTVEEWKEEYQELFTDYERKTLIGECIQEEIIERFGQQAYSDLCDSVEERCKRVISLENGDLENVDLTQEQEQLLEDLF